jgi:GNAT superfamily N-acetyltransferase
MTAFWLFILLALLSARGSKVVVTRNINLQLSMNMQRVAQHIINGKKYAMYRRFDDKQKIIHHELYRDTRVHSLVVYLMNTHEFIRKFFSTFHKSIAKCGVRSYTKSANGTMKELISELFLDNSSNLLMSLMVYMYVASTHRQLDIGSILLQYIINEGKALQANYLLLVHDDDGSNKLVKYYERKGFKEIFAFLEKGMLLKL